jgi:membrane protein DedA with SNARE-associated domain
VTPLAAGGVAVQTLVAATPSVSGDPGGVTGWLLHFNGPTAYAVIGFLAFAEAALLVGFFIPGETAVVIGGVLAGLGAVNLEVMATVVVICAIAGDSVGFEVGKRAGPWALGRRPLKGNAAVRRTIEMLEHYGGPAVFLGRFVAFARALIPGLAGMSGLRYRVFLFYNAIGGLIWGVGYTLLGYVVGVSFEHILSEVGLWSLAAVAAAIAIAIGVRQLARRRRRRQLAVALSDMGGGAGATGLATTDPASAPTVEAEAGASGRTSADPES